MCLRDSTKGEDSATAGTTKLAKNKSCVSMPSAEKKSINDGYQLNEIPLLSLKFLQQLWLTAVRGQRLPQLTFFWVSLICLTGYSESLVANVVLSITTTIVLSGYTLFFFLYQHSIKTIFNRKLPSKWLPSLFAHLALLRPIEILWRFLTNRFRVLPDVLVLGEVRCGTTSICQYLASLEGCHEPFCLWKHPELDRKETFYFVGHYLGHVAPSNYGMCFPLWATKFVQRVLLGNQFFTFDGCAQYLTSPSAPYLIARAYSERGLPPPILVACVRNPVDQAVSWWRYENNAMEWGSAMALTDWNTELRSKQYPPRTMTQAIEYSDSVSTLYEQAEQLAINNPSLSYLPSWSMTWPGGQLSAIGRNGVYASNIQRYERVFSEVFGSRNESSKKVPFSSKLRYVNVVPLEYLQHGCKLEATLRSLRQQIEQRNGVGVPTFRPGQALSSTRAVIHRNASVKLSNPLMEATKEEKEKMLRLFSTDVAELERVCGTSFGWN